MEKPQVCQQGAFVQGGARGGHRARQVGTRLKHTFPSQQEPSVSL